MRFWTIAAAAVGLLGCPGTPEDVRLDPPRDGFQLATAAFPVPEGQEVQRCYFFVVPGSGTDPVWVNRIVAAQNPGSHHLNVFRVKTVVGLDGEDGAVVDGGECWKSSNWADWPLVMNSQESSPGHNVVDWTLPEGVAHRFTPGEKLMLQTHYVNARTQDTPGRAKALVNFERIRPAAPPQELGTLFATNQHLRVCPGETRSFSASCLFARTPVTIVGANGHFHSRGVEFDMSVVDRDNVEQGAPFYENFDWSDPLFVRNTSVAVPQDGGVLWTCKFHLQADECADPTDSCCATFGGHVETQEHCNAFVYYYPKAADATCF